MDGPDDLRIYLVNESGHRMFGAHKHKKHHLHVYNNQAVGMSLYDFQSSESCDNMFTFRCGGSKAYDALV